MSQFIQVFKVFKEGTTEAPVTICRKQGEPFNESGKREKYLMLGYTITEI